MIGTMTKKTTPSKTSSRGSIRELRLKGADVVIEHAPGLRSSVCISTKSGVLLLEIDSRTASKAIKVLG